MKSSVLNNKNILCYLSITEHTEPQLRESILKHIHNNLTLAIRQSQGNTVAHVNKLFFEW